MTVMSREKPAGLKDAALILVGHGSARNPHAAKPTLRLAEAVDDRGWFDEISVCFWKESPPLTGALDRVQAKTVYVVPNFAGEGYFTRTVIPRELGLKGAHTRCSDGRVVHYCEPVGTHPRIAGMIHRRCEELIHEQYIDAGSVCVLLVGHGSSKPGGSADTAVALAETLRAANRYHSVEVAFLEQAPFVHEWREQVSAKQIIVVPLLIAEGFHGSQDLPPMFGLTPQDVRRSEPVLGPTMVDKRTVWYTRGIGSDPEIVEVILDQVAVRAEDGVEA